VPVWHRVSERLDNVSDRDRLKMVCTESRNGVRQNVRNRPPDAFEYAFEGSFVCTVMARAVLPQNNLERLNIHRNEHAVLVYMVPTRAELRLIRTLISTFNFDTRDFDGCIGSRIGMVNDDMFKITFVFPDRQTRTAVDAMCPVISRILTRDFSRISSRIRRGISVLFRHTEWVPYGGRQLNTRNIGLENNEAYNQTEIYHRLNQEDANWEQNHRHDNDGAYRGQRLSPPIY